MRKLQGPRQGPAGSYTGFSGCKKVKLEDGNSIKFKIHPSTCKLFCLSLQSVYAPLHKNRSCSMGTDASKHPLWTLTPATYHIHFHFNYLQSLSLKNKERDFNPGVLEVIFTFFTTTQVSRQSCLSKSRIHPLRISAFFFQYCHYSLFNRESLLSLIARYLALIIYLYCSYLILGWDNSL